MFNNNEQIINCYTCGDLTEQLIKNGKVIKNCNKCRESNNNKKRKRHRLLSTRHSQKMDFIITINL